MQFIRGKLCDALLVVLEPVRDERGFFARTFCEREFSEKGLQIGFVQHSISHTAHAGSIRGMHFQLYPHEEVKLLRCVKGAIHDVLIDIRPESPTYLQWESFRLDAANYRQLYVPAGMAHGFQTLEPDTEVHYLISAPYAPGASAGIRFDDPTFSIRWPLPVTDISNKDRTWPQFVSLKSTSS